MMVPQIAEAQYTSGYCVRLRFTDGVEGEIDLQDELWGNVFEPLKDLEFFRSFRFDKELNTLTWNNGADFAPEFLYAAVQEALQTQADHRS